MMVHEALRYAAVGFPVFPLKGKVPLTRRGFKDATTSEKIIVDWWRAAPHANIGLPVPPDILVLDIDPRHGGDTGLASLEAEHGPLPETCAVITGRRDGGIHYYLHAPVGRLSDRLLPDGIDIRVAGRHYVVAPPSIHPDTGKTYEWNGLTMDADCPPWLTDLIRSPIKPITPMVPRSDGTSGNGLVNHVANLTEGNRNHGFFWAVCTAITDGMYPTIGGDLRAAALSIGLEENEISATIASAERRVSR